MCMRFLWERGADGFSLLRNTVTLNCFHVKLNKKLGCVYKKTTQRLSVEAAILSLTRENIHSEDEK